MELHPKYKQLLWMAGLFCGLVLLLGFGMLFLSNNYFNGNYREIDPRDEIVIYIIAILVSWVTNLCLRVIPDLVYKPKEHPKWLIHHLLSYILYVGITYLLWHLLFRDIFNLGQKELPLSEVLTINTFIILAIEIISYRYEHENTRLEIANYKIILLQAQHEKLKHQLHPHFLFNSLNALKGLIKRNDQEAESYLIMLSEFLRFSISHNEQNIVSLKEEHMFCQYYIEMQKVRFKGAFIFNIDIPEIALTQMQLPVFSLQLLLENAIKHNVMTTANPLKINIGLISKDCLLVKNNFNPKMQLESSEGIGLKNLSERYRLLIDQDIKVAVDADYFMVYIKTIPI
jgi:two-component system LytT family sensor kinase